MAEKEKKITTTTTTKKKTKKKKRRKVCSDNITPSSIFFPLIKIKQISKTKN